MSSAEAKVHASMPLRLWCSQPTSVGINNHFKITDVACGGFVWYKVTRELAHCSNSNTASINATRSEIAMLSFFLTWG